MDMHYVLVVGVNLKKKDIPNEKTQQGTNSSLEEILEKKIKHLSKELGQENDHEKQQLILKSINLLLETMEKMKKGQ